MKKVLRTRFATAMILLLAIVTLVPLVTSTSGSPDITVKGKLEYVNELGGLSPMRRVKVYLMDNDTWEGFPQDEKVAWQYTDDAGNYEFIVDNNDGFGQNGRDPYIKVESTNPAAVAMSPFSVIYSMKLPQAGENVPDGFVYDYGAVHPDLNNEAWQSIDAVLSVRDWIFDRVTWERPMVTIYWPAISLWPSCEGNTIYLPDKAYWEWDHVEVYHQYALCVLYALYGNTFPAGWLGPIPPHRAFYESSNVFAFVAGWAEFMQCAVDNNPNNLVDWNGGHGGNIETNDWFNCMDMGDMDGAIVEGSVASVLWDIFDPMNEPHDHLDLGFDEIFYILRDYKPPDFSSFWNQWVLRYPAYQGDLSTICWVYGIDKDFYPPTGSIVINAGATYTTSTSVTLTVSASDYGSGVASMRFSNFPDAWFWGIWFPDFIWSKWYPYATSASWTLWPGDGTKTVFAQFMDKKGLMTEALSIPADSIILDTTPPVGSIVINGGNVYTTSTSVTLTLAYWDFTSGVWWVRYSNDGTAWTAWESPSTTKAWTLTPGDGTKTVYYQIQDHAGLISLTYVDTIILDATPPTGSILINGGNVYTQWPYVTLSLTYNDFTSGVWRVRYSNDGSTWTLWESPLPFRYWILTPGDGWKNVYYQVQDYAGNPSTFMDDIILDSTPPTTVASHGNPSSVVSLSAFDAWGVAATYYRIDWGPWQLYGGPFTVSVPPPYTHVIDYYSVDFAGNQENPKTLTVHYLTIDSNIGNIAPVNHPPQEGWYTEGYEAWTPTAPDKPSDGAGGWYGFQTWKKDTVAVPGNPIKVYMNGPHWARAGYLGLEVTGNKVGNTLYLTLRMRSEITYTYHMVIRIVGPDFDQSIDFGMFPLTGGVDLTTNFTQDVGGLSAGNYDVYIKLLDPATGDERARSKISFSVT